MKQNLWGGRFERQMDGEIEFTAEACVENRKSYGATAPEEVERQIGAAKGFIREVKGFSW